MCNNIKVFIREMVKHKITCNEIQNQGWGPLTQITLPGGGKIGVYQPRHAKPKPIKAQSAMKRKATNKNKRK